MCVLFDDGRHLPGGLDARTWVLESCFERLDPDEEPGAEEKPDEKPVENPVEKKLIVKYVAAMQGRQAS